MFGGMQLFRRVRLGAIGSFSRRLWGLKQIETGPLKYLNRWKVG
jgi:hypothetical protein